MIEIITLLLVVFTAAVAVLGVPVYLHARKNLQQSRLSSALGSAILTFVGFWAGIWMSNECMLWSYGRKRVAGLLTPAEMASVRGAGLVCSTTFAFERRGKRVGAMVVDGWRGARIYIGDDIAP